MDINEDFFITEAIDEVRLFKAFINLCMSLKPTITIWGDIAGPVLNQVSPYEITNKLTKRTRKFLFKERNYEVTPDNADIFLNLSEDINFKEISWGVEKDNVPIVFARASDDINISSSEFISRYDLRNLLEELKADRIINDFEVIKDKE